MRIVNFFDNKQLPVASGWQIGLAKELVTVVCLLIFITWPSSGHLIILTAHILQAKVSMSSLSYWKDLGKNRKCIFLSFNSKGGERGGVPRKIGKL